MKKILAIISLIFAVILLILAFTAFDCSMDLYYPNESYGGDAYTGIQNATAATARRVATLNNTVALVGGGFCWLRPSVCFASLSICLERMPLCFRRMV